MVESSVELKCHVLDTGHCLALEKHLLRGGRNRTVVCHSLVALLGHPRHGWLLWDSGYHPRLWDCTQRFPFRIYRWATPLRLRPELAVVAQLPRFDLTVDDVRRVVISHFHADHVAGLRDFPKAELFASKAGYEDVAGRTGLRALQRAFVPALLPDDFARRVVLLPAFDAKPLASFGPTCDLFGDGSAVLVSLPGHACGQLGLLARTDRGALFFVADSCWLSAAYRDNRPPHWLTHLFIDDAQTMRATLGLLHDFAGTHPEVQIVPSHCPEAYERYVGCKTSLER
jgi:glyoxylase-like metal-dependent hydrolase (beta-lactamase superfamily II)